MSGPPRTDAGTAVSALFAGNSATGGMARRHPQPQSASPANRRAGEERLRLGVELSESDIAFLRSLSRPSQTGQPRTLGSKFVATGVLLAAVELLRAGDLDMYGVEAGDLIEMTARARQALVSAALRRHAGEAAE